MRLTVNTPDRRVYLRGGLQAEIVLRRRSRWCWRVLRGDAVVGRGQRYTLDRARHDAQWTIDAATAAARKEA